MRRAVLFVAVFLAGCYAATESQSPNSAPARAQSDDSVKQELARVYGALAALQKENDQLKADVAGLRGEQAKPAKALAVEAQNVALKQARATLEAERQRVASYDALIGRMLPTDLITLCPLVEQFKARPLASLELAMLENLAGDAIYPAATVQFEKHGRAITQNDPFATRVIASLTVDAALVYESIGRIKGASAFHKRLEMETTAEGYELTLLRELERYGSADVRRAVYDRFQVLGRQATFGNVRLDGANLFAPFQRSADGRGFGRPLRGPGSLLEELERAAGK